MRCPFPGMDPYIELSGIWPDFHDRLVTHICEALQPHLRPRYVAFVQERLYVVEAERHIRPDVSIKATAPPQDSGGRLAVLEPDAHSVFEVWQEEVREPLIHIVEPRSNHRIVTAIELLSPSNKTPGDGRDSYLRKREEYSSSGTNLVEIDLLRQGLPTIRLSPGGLSTLGAWKYLVAVARRFPSRQEVYPIQLSQRLPRVAIPLASGDADPILELQSAFTRCWEAGAYPELLKHNPLPPNDLSEEEQRWCADLLRTADLA